jgi:hypothetical protein
MEIGIDAMAGGKIPGQQCLAVVTKVGTGQD